MGICFASLSRLHTPSKSSHHYAGSGGECNNVHVQGESINSNGGSNNNNIVFPCLEMRKLKEFKFWDLKAATKSFKSDTLLGEGGFGKVYKGWLDEKTLTPTKAGCGMTVAIKKLNPESMQGLREWLSEINFLGMISHPNLVKLLGYCCDGEEFLLVYEFMPKGSLENHLFWRNSNTEPLSWDTRLKIAIGAAKGLAYLHTSEKHIIYRDFKAANILLDEDYNAKISDFGLAKLGPSGGDSHVTTRIMGTYGYAAPEYIATGHLYVKSDVYGFGVVLLEMLTGLRALDRNRPNGQQNLVEWIKPDLSDRSKLKSIMDERIEGQYSSKAALKAAQITLKCLEPDPKKRPHMKDVLETLERIDAMKIRKDGCKKSCSGKSSRVNGEGSSVFPSVQVRNLKVFNFADLKAATKSFRAETLLGEGGFGKVYKGWLHEKTLTPTKAGSGIMVAVKKLNPESLQGFQEWQSEIDFLGKISHPHLVKLLGYCCDDVEFLLVYEFMPKGSLENHLFRRNTNTEPLSWDTRLKIAIGAARGLAFLHTSEKQIIYRDFKASNILLDEDYNAKISDFGLAKLGPSGGDSHVTTRIMGTYGYAAPEYIATGHLYVNSDVYGFGVVLLETLTGLRALDNNRPKEQQNLVEWAKPFLCDKRMLKSIMDERIEGQYSSKAAMKAAQLTLKCLERDPKRRPPMKEVLETLESIEAIKNRRK